jgi:uncharacterized protein
MPDVDFLVIGGLAAIVGAIVQSSVGLGLGLIAAPIVTLTLATAGVIAGTTGTATSIGGPPLALLYQREPGPEVRATLAAFFTIGALLSLITLAAVDQLPADQVIAGLALTPFALAGFLIAGPVRRYLDAGRLRTGILIVTSASAVALIVRSLL